MSHIKRATHIIENFRQYPISPGYIAKVEIDILKDTMVNWAEDFTDDLAETMVSASGGTAILGYIIKFGDDLLVTYIHKKLAKVGLAFSNESLLWALATILTEQDSEFETSDSAYFRISDAFSVIQHKKDVFIQLLEDEFHRVKRLARADVTSRGWFEVQRPLFILVITQLKNL